MTMEGQEASPGRFNALPQAGSCTCSAWPESIQTTSTCAEVTAGGACRAAHRKTTKSMQPGKKTQAASIFQDHGIHIFFDVSKILVSPGMRWQFDGILPQGFRHEISVGAEHDRRDDHTWIIIQPALE